MYGRRSTRKDDGDEEHHQIERLCSSTPSTAVARVKVGLEGKEKRERKNEEEEKKKKKKSIDRKTNDEAKKPQKKNFRRRFHVQIT